MSQQAFSPGNAVAGAVSGTAPTTTTGLANYVCVNKTLGTVNGTITGSGTTTTYTIRSQAIHPSQEFEVTGNGTADFLVNFTLEAGESLFFVLNSSANGSLVLGDCEMRHTASGARNTEFDQVFLSTLQP